MYRKKYTKLFVFVVELKNFTCVTLNYRYKDSAQLGNKLLVPIELELDTWKMKRAGVSHNCLLERKNIWSS